MNKIGRKSIVVEAAIPNYSNPGNHYIVRVQANKNHGICNIVQGTKVPQEIIDKRTKKKRTVMKFFPIQCVGSVLSTFQGRQYDDPEVFNNLKVALTNTLNSYE